MYLDGDWWVLERAEANGVKALVLRHPIAPLAVAFTSRVAANHLAQQMGQVQLRLLQNWRDKEDWLLGLLEQGIEGYWHQDATPGLPQVDATPGLPQVHAVRAALVYVQSHKTQTACL